MKRSPILIPAVLAALAFGAQPAGAHVVQPGESLWSVASANGISAGTLAAANGLAADAPLISGTTITVPVGAGSTTVASTTTQSSGGGRVVQPGESLWSIASANGISVSSLAAANGLSSTAQLISGSSLTIPAAAATTSTAPVVYSGSNPVPTNERLDGGVVGDIGGSYGMSRSLVQAVGWQESGFNNSLTSSANARGIMQIIPPTWDFINKNLAGGSLSPASAHDNVAAGSLYLRYLYRLKGGDRDATIASYYQGPGRTTMLPETQKYVSSVLGFKGFYDKLNR
jgi:soluble lytic murein transglycosylase-like protein